MTPIEFVRACVERATRESVTFTSIHVETLRALVKEYERTEPQLAREQRRGDEATDRAEKAEPPSLSLKFNAGDPVFVWSGSGSKRLAEFDLLTREQAERYAMRVAEAVREACAEEVESYIDNADLCGTTCRDEVSAVGVEIRATPLVGGEK